MNYLFDRDKEKKRKRFWKFASSALVIVLIIYFHTAVWQSLAGNAQFIFSPIFRLGKSFSLPRSSLEKENEDLRNKLMEAETKIANKGTLESENLELKEILSRKGEGKSFLLSAILAKPNRSLYDTLVIDVGEDQGVEVNDRVFAFGNIPIGRIAEVYGRTSKVILFTNPGEKTEAIINGKDIFIEAVGRGGGNFEIILPRDLVLELGTEITLPGITPYTLAILESIISDPRDSLQKAILVSPVNIQELRFVEVEQ